MSASLEEKEMKMDEAIGKSLDSLYSRIDSLDGRGPKKTRRRGSRLKDFDTPDSGEDDIYAVSSPSATPSIPASTKKHTTETPAASRRRTPAPAETRFATEKKRDPLPLPEVKKAPEVTWKKEEKDGKEKDEGKGDEVEREKGAEEKKEEPTKKKGGLFGGLRKRLKKSEKKEELKAEDRSIPAGEPEKIPSSPEARPEVIIPAPKKEKRPVEKKVEKKVEKPIPPRPKKEENGKVKEELIGRKEKFSMRQFILDRREKRLKRMDVRFIKMEEERKRVEKVSDRLKLRREMATRTERQVIDNLATTGIELAPVYRRALAYIIDLIVIIAITAAIISTFDIVQWWILALLIVSLLYFSIMESLFGRGLGKLLMNIYTVTLDFEYVPYPNSFGQAVFKALIPWSIIDAIFALTHPLTKQSLSNRICGIIVIKGI